MASFIKPVMQPEEFRLIREFVAGEFGIIIEEGRSAYLAAKLLARLDELGLDSFMDYYVHLKFSPACAVEQRQFLSILTNNETYFFRENAQLQVLAGEILPKLKYEKNQRDQKKLRIYSAGCSSGEEVYTIAMLLLESGLFLWDWDIQVTGIDIDPQMVARARGGVYGSRAFQATPAHCIDRYFKKCGDEYEVKSTLRMITRFEEGNLLRLEPFEKADPASIVFCRNVFIYFSEETTRRVVDSFARLLEPGGYLFLGHSESLSRVTSQFQPIRHPGAIIYRKRD